MTAETAPQQTGQAAFGRSTGAAGTSFFGQSPVWSAQQRMAEAALHDVVWKDRSFPAGVRPVLARRRSGSWTLIDWLGLVQTHRGGDSLAHLVGPLAEPQYLLADIPLLDLDRLYVAPDRTDQFAADASRAALPDLDLVDTLDDLARRRRELLSKVPAEYVASAAWALAQGRPRLWLRAEEEEAHQVWRGLSAALQVVPPSLLRQYSSIANWVDKGGDFDLAVYSAKNRSLPVRNELQRLAELEAPGPILGLVEAAIDAARTGGATEFSRLLGEPTTAKEWMALAQQALMTGENPFIPVTFGPAEERLIRSRDRGQVKRGFACLLRAGLGPDRRAEVIAQLGGGSPTAREVGFELALGSSEDVGEAERWMLFVDGLSGKAELYLTPERARMLVEHLSASNDPGLALLAIRSVGSGSLRTEPKRDQLPQLIDQYVSLGGDLAALHGIDTLRTPIVRWLIERSVGIPDGEAIRVLEIWATDVMDGLAPIERARILGLAIEDARRSTDRDGSYRRLHALQDVFGGHPVSNIELAIGLDGVLPSSGNAARVVRDLLQARGVPAASVTDVLAAIAAPTPTPTPTATATEVETQDVAVPSVEPPAAPAGLEPPLDSAQPAPNGGSEVRADWEQVARTWQLEVPSQHLEDKDVRNILESFQSDASVMLEEATAAHEHRLGKRRDKAQKQLDDRVRKLDKAGGKGTLKRFKAQVLGNAEEPGEHRNDGEHSTGEEEDA